MNLTPGQCPVPAQSCGSGSPRAAVDASAFRLYADGKVQGDADMVFYGQPRNDDGTVSWSVKASTQPLLSRSTG